MIDLALVNVIGRAVKLKDERKCSKGKILRVSQKMIHITSATSVLPYANEV